MPEEQHTLIQVAKPMVTTLQCQHRPILTSSTMQSRSRGYPEEAFRSDQTSEYRMLPLIVRNCLLCALTRSTPQLRRLTFESIGSERSFPSTMSSPLADSRDSTSLPSTSLLEPALENYGSRPSPTLLPLPLHYPDPRPRHLRQLFP